jgi:pyruvate/2-oxoglutarate dehydrogenase complex dihydrolipoamide dehydrogenase (E3) component
MQIAIIGTGYVGLTTGTCFAFLGHDVTCIDVDESKVESLRAGKAPIYEPYLDELLEQSRQRIRFTTKYEEGLSGAEVTARQSSQMGGPRGVFGFGKVKPRVSDDNKPKVTFKDVSGADEAK